MTTATCFIEPLDVLYLRGNKLFGDPGSYGEALIPPWPSVAAGALRSRILADDGTDLAGFARSEITHDTLGTPTQPGSFTVQAFHLARRLEGGTVEPLFLPPADLVPGRDEAGQLKARTLTPTRLTRIDSSFPLSWVPVLAENQRSKPESGYWLTLQGWQSYLAGGVPATEDWVDTSKLWAIDPRVGVGLDAEKRSAAEGKLFSMQAVALHPGVGFLVQVAGATLPTAGTLRLGGDGRAAALTGLNNFQWPKPDYESISNAGRCKLVLTTPGIFHPDTGEGLGWLPTGIYSAAKDEQNRSIYHFNLHGIKGRLVCAAVPRAEVVSGWDLAQWQPKPAQRAAPAGSVYWLDELEATPEALRGLVKRGLWSDDCEDAARRAEGFNRLTLAAWPLL